MKSGLAKFLIADNLSKEDVGIYEKGQPINSACKTVGFGAYDVQDNMVLKLSLTIMHSDFTAYLAEFMFRQTFTT